jgi:hypothetical protein
MRNIETLLIENGIPVPVAEQVAALLDSQDGRNEEWLYELAWDFIKLYRLHKHEAFAIFEGKLI